MLRVILDEQGGCTHDLFIKIDGSPSRVWIADTTWLGAFFDPTYFSPSTTNRIWSDEEIIVGKKADVVLLIQLWQQMLLSDASICFLPYDLSDQYIAALQVIKRKKLYQINQVWSPEITGGATEKLYLQMQSTIAWQQSNDQGLEWKLAPSSILTGLAWSLANLERPVTPLTYD